MDIEIIVIFFDYTDSHSKIVEQVRVYQSAEDYYKDAKEFGDNWIAFSSDAPEVKLIPRSA